jgi:hypothetical protein
VIARQYGWGKRRCAGRSSRQTSARSSSRWTWRSSGLRSTETCLLRCWRIRAAPRCCGSASQASGAVGGLAAVGDAQCSRRPTDECCVTTRPTRLPITIPVAMRYGIPTPARRPTTIPLRITCSILLVVPPSPEIRNPHLVGSLRRSRFAPAAARREQEAWGHPAARERSVRCPGRHPRAGRQARNRRRSPRAMRARADARRFARRA